MLLLFVDFWLLAKRLARQSEAVISLHQPVQDGVGDRGVTDPCMPMLDGQLAGDDGGLVGRPVVDDFQQVSARLRVDAGHAPVVQQQNIGLCQLDQPVPSKCPGSRKQENSIPFRTGNPGATHLKTSDAVVFILMAIANF